MMEALVPLLAMADFEHDRRAVLGDSKGEKHFERCNEKQRDLLLFALSGDQKTMKDQCGSNDLTIKAMGAMGGRETLAGRMGSGWAAIDE